MTVRDVNYTCDDFFHHKPWPMPVDVMERGVVKLCQNEVEGGLEGKPFFATLFSTTDRIPVYTANAIVLHRGAKSYDRPSSEYWKRVALGLCGRNALPVNSVDSIITFTNHTELKMCRKYQAVCEDYHDNELDLDRGHLSPNAINSQNLEKQRATFTLTNAAPQFAKFNQHSWRVYECVTMYTILDLVPGEKVYILTGTYGTALDKNNKPLWLNKNELPDKNPVKVPGYYWKAVCYPGNSHNAAWGYAIVQKNVNVKEMADFRNYMTLKIFADKYFLDLPFGSECLNASFGQFGKHVFPTWNKFIDSHCSDDY
ncbi:unnamed protein product [Clavelina lepadiformis]|uniref:Endonuclease n=1 Tax=Clavelina lepadiformis TaxID=159417 RepID=A0ABP0GUG8_CLALP